MGCWHSGTQLIFWSGLCLDILTLNCFAVIFDMLYIPAADLQLLRQEATLPAEEIASV
jgi:hypothetical protein